MNSTPIQAWEDYSSNSENEDENHSSLIISEATKQLFLRKYSASSLSEKELLTIFSSSHYNDKEIKIKIEERIKKLLLCRKKEDLKIEQDNYDYNYGYNHSFNGKHNNNYSKCYKKDYYSNSNNKGGYYNKKNYQKDGNRKINNWNGYDQSKEGYYPWNNYYSNIKQYDKMNTNSDVNANSNKKTYETEVIELNDINKRNQEIDEDQRTTSKNSTTPSKTQEIMSISSIEAIPEISLTYITEKEDKAEPSSINIKDHRVINDVNKQSIIEKGSNGACYPSKLFPGVFFNRPIEPNYNPLHQYQINRQDSLIKNPFSQVYNYYMLGNNNAKGLFNSY